MCLFYTPPPPPLSLSLSFSLSFPPRIICLWLSSLPSSFSLIRFWRYRQKGLKKNNFTNLIFIIFWWSTFNNHFVIEQNLPLSVAIMLNSIPPFNPIDDLNKNFDKISIQEEELDHLQPSLRMGRLIQGEKKKIWTWPPKQASRS